VSDPVDLAYTSATAALAMFRSGDLSPRELMEAVIARAEATESSLNAFTDRHFDEALEAAIRAGDAYAKGSARPLEGLAVAVKDESRIAGQRTTQGSLLFANDVADCTDIVNQRILDAGGIVHARTATPEFSMTGVTWSLLHGITRNPWNLAMTCGGSSGGSGASVAAGSSTLATGSDIGGSIRWPAAMNGAVGFKPPHGRNPDVFPWNRERFSSHGPIARTVADAALLQNVMSGPADADMLSLERFELPARPSPAGGMRVALSRDLGYFHPNGEVTAALAVAAERLRSTGIEVEEVELDWTDRAMEVALTHLGFQARAILGSALPGADWSRLTPYIRGWMEEEPVTLEAWISSWEYADAMYRELQQKVFSAGYDALICPTSTTNDVPADLGHPDTGAQGLPLSDLVPLIMTYPFNILFRLPVLNVPMGLAPSNGVPLGMQIVGPKEADAIPFRLAAAYESATGNLYEQKRPPLRPLGAAG
jgi:Asp-tRNA(Asn)/Glu-tRNA(Gln) amidotransferase A subunit family amidase